jgi:hypothetical protein
MVLKVHAVLCHAADHKAKDKAGSSNEGPHFLDIKHRIRKVAATKVLIF